MLRYLIHLLTILHLGPAIGFALMAFGCNAEAPWLGAVCRAGPVMGFLILTALSWVVLGVISAIQLKRGWVRVRDEVPGSLSAGVGMGAGSGAGADAGTHG